MQDVSSRYATVRKIATAMMAAGLLGGAAMIVIGVMWMTRTDAPDRPAGTTMVAGGGLLLLLAVLLRGMTAVLVKIQEQLYRLHDTTLDLVDQVKSYEKPMTTLVANSEISDAARSIAHRAKEREALRVAIREEVAIEDWELSYSLLDEMERRFGDTQETTSLREQVDAARQEQVDTQIAQAVALVEEYCDGQAWDKATAEAGRLQKVFGNHERINRLPELVIERRAAYKQGLLEQWDEALSRKDIDGGIDILHLLDPYLSVEEAKEIEQSARGVFHEKLMNMRVQFSLAVKEKRWTDAVQVGQSIINEYPNSRMAKEVAETMDALRTRAGEAREQDRAGV